MIYNEFLNTTNKYSSNTAIVCEDISYTYLEVNNYILELMPLFNDIQKSGLIYLEKNEFSIIFQLALNATKNVFTPIDIATPLERVQEICSQLSAQWIISLKDFSQQGYKIKYSHEKFYVWEKIQSTRYDLEVSHIFFSSGSTGKPKGIMLSSEPVIRVVKEQAHLIGMKAGKKFAWLLSPAFDASLSDIYLTLLSGGQIYICNFPQNKIKTLTKYLKENEITHSDISPSVLPLLKLSELSLEAIIFGGEVANETVIKEYSEKINMFNAYGPTENTICSSFKKVNQNWNCRNIGTPLKEVEFLVADNQELLIAGPNLCISYTDEFLNKQKFFIKDNVRYYKTGDLVEYKNGEYFYLGRIDRQFKNNGILISPEEIEYYAKQAGCVEAKCKKEDKFVLYYQGNITESELRIFLEKKLNKNMIPTLFMKLDSFKTNINGKTMI